jgi:hypothetical protein
MQNIDFEVGHNVGGIDPILFFVPVEDVEEIPEEVGVTITDNIVFVTDKKFYIARFILDTLSFSEQKDVNKYGAAYKQKITGSIAKDTPDLANILYEMQQQRFICIYRDSNGFYKLVGSINNYLLFEHDLDTDNNSSGRNGVKVTFRGESRTPAFFYEGLIETYDTIIDTTPVEVCEPVSIKDGAGNVIEVVPAGGEFYITLISANTSILT